MNPAPTTNPASAPTLHRSLTLFDVLCIGINAIVGSGVFALPDDMYRSMGGWSPFAFALCAVLLLPVALCFAELAGRHEDTGGAYLYARAAFGAHVGFIVGWYCWVNTFVSWGANARLFVELAGVPRGIACGIVAAGTIVALGVVNYFGVKPGAWVVNLVTIGKLTAILCFLAVGLMAMKPDPLGGPLPLGIAGVGQGIYLSLFPLQGFEVAPVAAGETQNPRRNVPLGTVGSLVISTILFVIVQAVLVATYPRIGSGSEQPLVDAARFLGPTLGAIVLTGSLISTGGFTAGNALGAPRYALAIAGHGLLPSRIARVHPRWRTPHVAIGLTTGSTAILALFFNYRQLVGMSNITVVIQYLFTCLAVPVLRKKQPLAAGAWRIPGGPVVPGIGAAGSIALLVFGLVLPGWEAASTEVLFAAGTFAVGVVIAVLVGWRRPSASPQAPAPPGAPGGAAG